MSRATAEEPLATLVEKNLAHPEQPSEQLMLAPGAAEEVLRRMTGKHGRRLTPYFRLLRWLGDKKAIPALLRFENASDIDRYEWVRTLVALDAPEAQRLAVKLFREQPAFGAPLVRYYEDDQAIRQATELLNREDPRNWRYAAWVLGGSRDTTALDGMETRIARMRGQGLTKEFKYAPAYESLVVAVRRLMVEQRDVRSEALWEYLRQVQNEREDERLWCLAELGRMRDSALVTSLKQSPWQERAKHPGRESALLLWARHQAGDSLNSDELRRFRIGRYHLEWLPGGTRWPPARDTTR